MKACVLVVVLLAGCGDDANVPADAELAIDAAADCA